MAPQTRPNFIGLGHELIHAQHFAEGNDLGSAQGTHSYKNAAGVMKTETLDREELRTSGVGGYGDWFGPTENRLRSQHGLPERGSYGYEP